LTEKEEIVRKGYDKIAKQYHADRHIFDNRKELEQFVSLLPRNARVLDVGYGSQSMLKLAGRNVPEANLIKQDATRLGFQTNSFDGLTSFYCIIHIPREKHASLFQSFHRILKPEGVMLISMGHSEWEGTEKYYGVDMFWSHYKPEKSLQIIENAGLLAIWDKIVECGGEKPYWVLARNKK